MPVKRTVWQRRPMGLTSLIDIIFLLLLFFMLSSTFTRFGELPLLNASGGSTNDASPLFLQLSAESISLNGEVVQADALLAVIAEKKADEETQILLVTLGDEVTSQQLVDLLAVLRGVPDLTVSVLE